ncbi:hypothetical protein V6Z11_A11G174500 [Gossypium hirsutum]
MMMIMKMRNAYASEWQINSGGVQFGGTFLPELLSGRQDSPLSRSQGQGIWLFYIYCCQSWMLHLLRNPSPTPSSLCRLKAASTPYFKNHRLPMLLFFLTMSAAQCRLVLNSITIIISTSIAKLKPRSFSCCLPKPLFIIQRHNISISYMKSILIH